MSHPQNLEVFVSLKAASEQEGDGTGQELGGGGAPMSLATSSQHGLADEGSRLSGKAGAQEWPGEVWAVATSRLNR